MKVNKDKIGECHGFQKDFSKYSNFYALFGLELQTMSE